MKNLKQLFGDVHGLDEKSLESLTNALEKNNLPGFDYIEFKQALGTLAQMNMDESTAFRSAFATASTMGLTKEKLLKTADHYKGILNSEKKQFDATLQKQMQQRVQSKREEVAKLQKQVEEYQTKIAEMQKKIAEYQDVIEHADEDIKLTTEKIEEVQKHFEFTYQSIVNEIEKDVQNITQYL